MDAGFGGSRLEPFGAVERAMRQLSKASRLSGVRLGQPSDRTPAINASPDPIQMPDGSIAVGLSLSGR
jgi:hypothetical protein